MKAFSDFPYFLKWLYRKEKNVFLRNISARAGISYSQNGSFFLFLDQVNEATASANGDFNDTHRDRFPF